MDEKTSLRNLHFGLRDNGRTVYSNLPPPELYLQLKRLEEIDRRISFLQPNCDWTILNTSTDNYFSRTIALQLFPELVENNQEKVSAYQYPHHDQESWIDSCQAGNLEVLCRDKNEASISEKFARKNAQRTTERPINLQLPYHAIVRDTYGLACVLPNRAACEELESRLYHDPRLDIVEVEHHHKPSGYLATHLTAIWGRNTVPTGSIVEIHLETKEDHNRNKQGDGLNTSRSHSSYGQGKIEAPHDQGQNQIIILQRDEQAERKLVPLSITNQFAEYTLINY